MKFHIVLAVLLAGALTLVLPAGAKTPSPVEPGFAPLRLASTAQILVDAISNGPSEVGCDLLPGQFGRSYAALDELYVEPFICQRINALATSPQTVARLPDGSRILFRTALALSVLVHESWHLSDEPWSLDEAWTDCREIQTSWAFAELLGADHATAVRLGQISVSIHYLKVMFSPKYENLAKCRAGGEWDLSPSTPAWPIG